MQNSYNNPVYEKQNRQNYEFAGFWIRFAAFLLDYVVVSAGLLIIRLITRVLSSQLDIFDSAILFQFSINDIILYIFKVLYFILLTYYTGTTLGKRAMGLRVISICGNIQPTFFDVVYRETIGKFLSGICLSVGYILAGLDGEKRALHDILCDTRVIYAKKIKIYPVFQNPVPPAPWHMSPIPPQGPAAPNPNYKPNTPDTPNNTFN